MKSDPHWYRHCVQVSAASDGEASWTHGFERSHYFWADQILESSVLKLIFKCKKSLLVFFGNKSNIGENWTAAFFALYS